MDTEWGRGGGSEAHTRKCVNDIISDLQKGEVSQGHSSVYFVDHVVILPMRLFTLSVTNAQSPVPLKYCYCRHFSHLQTTLEPWFCTKVYLQFCLADQSLYINPEVWDSNFFSFMCLSKIASHSIAWNIDSLAFLLTSLFTTTDRLSVHNTADTASVSLLTHSSLTHKQDPEIL